MRVSVIASLAACGALLVAGAALADVSLPHQKLGLWQQVFTTGANKISDQVCLDAASEAKLSTLRSQFSNTNCQSKQVTHNRDGWSIVSTCEPRKGWKTTSHVDVTGDFNSKFTAVINSTTTGAPLGAAHGTHQTTLVSTWLGPCKAGQKGGDVIMGNGMKINLLDAAKAPH